MKKLFLLTALSAALFVGCNNDKKDESADKKMDDQKMSSSTEDKEERNKKVAMASIDALNAHNIDQMLKEAAPDCVDYGDGTHPPTKGADSIRAAVQGWFTAFPDVKGENLKAVSDGEWVLVWGDWSGTWKGDFMGQKATNKSYKIKDVDIFRFNDEGKVTEHHNIQSSLPVAMQIGMKMQ